MSDESLVSRNSVCRRDASIHSRSLYAIQLLSFVECHGLRCDHVFLPPEAIAGGLGVFEAVDASVVFTEPSVTVEGCCCGLMGQGSLVTLSDHYAVRIELQRSLCRVSPP